MDNFTRVLLKIAAVIFCDSLVIKFAAGAIIVYEIIKLRGLFKIEFSNSLYFVFFVFLFNYVFNFNTSLLNDIFLFFLSSFNKIDIKKLMYIYLFLFFLMGVISFCLKI